jgi:hypothetical protein
MVAQYFIAQQIAGKNNRNGVKELRIENVERRAESEFDDELFQNLMLSFQFNTPYWVVV